MRLRSIRTDDEVRPREGNVRGSFEPVDFTRRFCQNPRHHHDYGKIYQCAYFLE